MRAARFILLLLLLVPAALALAGPARALPEETLTIRTLAGQSYQFRVEIARSEAEREVGLMNRPALAADRGMLFDFDPPRPVSFWMKNTLIPLDIVFIDPKGTVIGIAARAVPMSLDILPSPGICRGVLEVNGGTAERLGIGVGAKVIHRLFGN